VPQAEKDGMTTKTISQDNLNQIAAQPSLQKIQTQVTGEFQNAQPTGAPKSPPQKDVGPGALPNNESIARHRITKNMQLILEDLSNEEGTSPNQNQKEKKSENLMEQANHMSNTKSSYNLNKQKHFYQHKDFSSNFELKMGASITSLIRGGVRDNESVS